MSRRSVDAALGVFTGVLAYYLHETNPRTAPLTGETLTELVRWKRAKRAAQQQADDSEAEMQTKFQELLREDKAKAS